MMACSFLDCDHDMQLNHIFTTIDSHLAPAVSLGAHYRYSIPHSTIEPYMQPQHFAPGARRNIPIKHQLSHLHYHPNCFSMSMKLARSC